jgi:hypothetical protein
MRKLQAILGYTAAGLAMPVMIIALLLLVGGGLDKALTSALGLSLSPTINGGEVTRTISHGTYETQVHRMVFDSLIGQRREGFIQIDWTPLASLPASIDEQFDADADGKPDFRLQVDTAKESSTLTPYASWVMGLEGTYRRQASLAVRVHLKNTAREE